MFHKVLCRSLGKMVSTLKPTLGKTLARKKGGRRRSPVLIVRSIETLVPIRYKWVTVFDSRDLEKTAVPKCHIHQQVRSSRMSSDGWDERRISKLATRMRQAIV